MAQTGHSHQTMDDVPKYYIGVSPLDNGFGLFAREDLITGTQIFEEVPYFKPNKEKYLLTHLAVYRAVLDLPQDQLDSFLKRSHAGNMPSRGAPAKVSFKPGTRAPPFPVQETKIQMYSNNLARCLSSWERNVYPENEQMGGLIHAIWLNSAFKTGHEDAAFFFDAAILNHSCVPNCYAAWNARLEKLTLYAIRDIQKGEELLICYNVDHYLLKPRDERQQGLKESYNFDCVCEVCDKELSSFQAGEDKRIRFADYVREPSRQSDIVNEKIIKDMIQLMMQQKTLTWEMAMLHNWLAQWYYLQGTKEQVVTELETIYRIALMCFGKDHEITETAKIEHSSGELGRPPRWRYD